MTAPALPPAPALRRAALALLLALPLAVVPPAAMASEDAPGTESAPAGAADALPRVTVTRAAVARLIGRVPVTGSLVAREEVAVNPRIAGRTIVAVHADIGDRVEKGALLVELDSEALQVQLSQARAQLQQALAGLQQARAQVALSEAQLDQARTSFERDRRLRASGAIPEAQFDRSRTALETARAQLQAARDGVAAAEARVEAARVGVKLAELNLSWTRITAPAGGIIASRNTDLGAVAAAGPRPLFRIIRDGEIEAEVEVIETDIARLSVGDRAELRVAGLGRLTGTVRRIPPRVDPRTRLGKVRIALQPGPALRTGLFATGWITTDEIDAPAVPVSAVLSDAGGDFVLVVDDKGEVHKRRVTTGLVWKGLREIRAGLEPGTRVMLRAGAFFREGDRVVPVEAVPPAAQAMLGGTGDGSGGGAGGRTPAATATETRP